MCSSSVAPMPLMMRIPVASCQARQVAAGRFSPAETHRRSDESVPVGAVEERSVRGRGGEQDGHPVLGDRGQQLPRPRVFEQQRRGAGPQREDDEPAEPERETERRAPREHVVRRRPQDMARERVRDGEDVPVEVHAALGAPGRARRERDQGDVVGGGRHGLVRLGQPGDAPEEVVGPLAAERRDAQPGHLGLHQVVHGPGVAQRVRDPGDGADRRQLLRPRLREHGDGDRACLHHGQPTGREPRRGGAAQQHPVPRPYAQLTAEQMRDPVDAAQQLPVCPHLPVARAERGTVGAEPFDGAVEQLGPAVQLLRIAQFGEVEDEVGPEFGRREVVAREGVDVGRRVLWRSVCHGRAPPRNERPCLWWARGMSVS